MTIKERDIERYLVAQCKKHGVFCRKWVSVNSRGVPDRIILYNGEWAAVELKRPGGKLTKLQEVEHRAIRKAGGYVFVLDSKDGVDEFIAYILQA